MDGNTILIQTPVSVESAKSTPNMLFPIGSSATIIPLSQKTISLKDWLSCHLFVSSDYFPTPNSVRVVDDETQSDFERDQASNPFNSKSFFDTYSATDRIRTTVNIDKTGKLLAWQDVCDLHTKDESLGLIGSHWDMVDKLPLVMTNPMIKPMSSIISDAIMANSSLDLKPLMLKVPQRLSNQGILYNSTATATATPFKNINNYSLMTTDGTDSPRGGAKSNIRHPETVQHTLWCTSPTLPENDVNLLYDICLLFQYISCVLYEVCHILLFEQLIWKEA
ncbi:hypothetical protein BY996DRAFT_6417820 [Phakopsora pachyrhizi]|nr:hypothetical protein BY996DRAFT_6417820 [Phakopsora pachyrhizi]